MWCAGSLPKFNTTPVVLFPISRYNRLVEKNPNKRYTAGRVGPDGRHHDAKLTHQKRLYLRHGRCDLPRQPSLTRRAGICRLAPEGTQEIPLPHQQQRQDPARTAIQALPHGPGHRRKAFLHQRPGHRQVHCRPDAQGQSLRHRGAGPAQRPV